MQVVQKHGPLIGSLATDNRHLHENGPAFHHHPVEVGDRIRCFDQPAENYFW